MTLVIDDRDLCESRPPHQREDRRCLVCIECNHRDSRHMGSNLGVQIDPSQQSAANVTVADRADERAVRVDNQRDLAATSIDGSDGVVDRGVHRKRQSGERWFVDRCPHERLLE